MRTRLTLRPGQPGTLSLRKEHGDRLVCVPYRYDEQACKRLKTVELIVESTDWDPDPKQDHEIVPVWVDWHEQELRDYVKSAGGRWNAQQRVWHLRYDQVTRLGLLDRIVRDSQ